MDTCRKGWLRYDFRLLQYDVNDWEHFWLFQSSEEGHMGALSVVQDPFEWAKCIYVYYLGQKITYNFENKLLLWLRIIKK